jgi:hypothetical protein
MVITLDYAGCYYDEGDIPNIEVTFHETIEEAEDHEKGYYPSRLYDLLTQQEL